MKLFSFAFAAVLSLASFAGAAFAQSGNTLTIQLKDGPVVIQLMPDVAPKHVAQIEALAKKGAYDNVAFHRVIEGFMLATSSHGFKVNFCKFTNETRLAMTSATSSRVAPSSFNALA